MFSPVVQQGRRREWHIKFPGNPFANHNLMMVAGANHLCDYIAQIEGHLS